MTEEMIRVTRRQPSKHVRKVQPRITRPRKRKPLAPPTWNTIMEESCILPILLVRAYFEGNLEEVVQKIVEENSKWQISSPSSTSPKTSSEAS